jgi:hypothetical protein
MNHARKEAGGEFRLGRVGCAGVVGGASVVEGEVGFVEPESGGAEIVAGAGVATGAGGTDGTASSGACI